MTKDPMQIQEKITNALNESSHGKGDPLELFHPSAAGYCKRQIYLKKRDMKRYDDYVKGAMKVGSVIHEDIQDIDFGRDVEIEKEVEYNPSEYPHYYKGKCDIYDPEADVVYDIKTTANMKYTDKPHHRAQLQIYMKALDVDRGYLLYVSKKSHAKNELIEVKRDDDKIEEINEKVKEVYEVLREEERNIPFDKCDCYFCDSEGGGSS